MTPKISIVMPVYNVEKYLRECLDSVRAQTFTDWECICVDDGSSDASPAILDEYAAKDPRFRVIKREHTNAGACRNVGMDVAQGEFLSFLDSDDVFAPRMIVILHNAIEKHHADIATCGALKFRDGERVPRLNRTTGAGNIVFEKPATTMDTFRMWIGQPWDKMFRRSFVKSLGIRFQEIRSANDEFFVDIAVASANRIVHVDRPLIAYRKHVSSLQATQHKDPLCVIYAIEAVHREMDQRGMFRDHPLLFDHFRAWVARASQQLLRIGSPEGYEKLHREFSRLCREHHLDRLSQQDIPFSDDRFAWFQTLCSGSSPLETLWTEAFYLRHEVEGLRPLRGIDCTHAYRIGRIIMWLPKRVKRLFHFH